MVYQEITYNFIDELKKHNMTLSQFDKLKDLYSQLPEKDRHTLWCAETELVRLEKQYQNKENT